MRRIYDYQIKELVKKLCIQANTVLRRDVFAALKSALKKEKNKIAKRILSAIIKNALIAQKEGLAICQDTGMAVIFLEVGQDLKITGDLYKAIQEGVRQGYKKGYLRDSIVDPILRNFLDFNPAVIHTEFIKGDRVRITVLPKGFGCENKTKLRMFNPTVSLKEVEDFIIETVRSAGPDACPPFVIGVGIGGTADYACFLAKKALLKKIPNSKFQIPDKSKFSNFQIFKLERKLLDEINKLNIGPMGLGGKTTSLAVNIITYPTHIAGLPVAINISCHVLRSATEVL
ncbi:MAG: fumarate hydratase [Candidatus Omnitrophica bacterium]|nr:fumarate hydratase [Candidatus Omnitrophota bacterium]